MAFALSVLRCTISPRYRCSTKTEAPDGGNRSEASVQSPPQTMASALRPILGHITPIVHSPCTSLGCACRQLLRSPWLGSGLCAYPARARTGGHNYLLLICQGVARPKFVFLRPARSNRRCANGCAARGVVRRRRWPALLSTLFFPVFHQSGAGFFPLGSQSLRGSMGAYI